MDMKRRILSCFLAFCMIFALLPAPAQAAGNAENATPTVTATVQHNRDGSGAETGQITAQIEAYMTDPANKTRTVKPCDIIFLIEQSKFMNTQNGSANSGDERAEILSAVRQTQWTFCPLTEAATVGSCPSWYTPKGLRFTFWKMKLHPERSLTLCGQKPCSSITISL